MANLTTVTLTSGAGTGGTGTVSTLDNVIGTAGSPSAQVQTVQGVTSMTPLKVDGSGVTQPVSLASTTITGTAAVTQSGTWTVQPGNTANTTAWKVDGSAVTQPVSGTVSANPATAASWGVGTSTQNSATVSNGTLALGQFNTTPTTITSGNMSPVQMDSAGNLLVNVKAGGGAGGTSSTLGSATPSTATAVGFSDGTNMVMAKVKAASTGSAPATDPALVVTIRDANANVQSGAPVTIVAQTPTATANGLTASRVVASATSNTATNLKASAGQLYEIDVFNTAAYSVFLKLYNKATAPTVGTDTPVITIPIAAGTGYARTFTMGRSFATGIGYGITKLQPDSDTTALIAGDLTGSIAWV